MTVSGDQLTMSTTTIGELVFVYFGPEMNNIIGVPGELKLLHIY